MMTMTTRKQPILSVNLSVVAKNDLDLELATKYVLFRHMMPLKSPNKSLLYFCSCNEGKHICRPFLPSRSSCSELIILNNSFSNIFWIALLVLPSNFWLDVLLLLSNFGSSVYNTLSPLSGSNFSSVKASPFTLNFYMKALSQIQQYHCCCCFLTSLLWTWSNTPLGRMSAFDLSSLHSPACIKW
jgi:hypothetical protein